MVNFLCSFQGVIKRKTSKSHRISGDYSLRGPPVPIPNTEVKPQHADSTWLETAREGRSSPDSIKRHSFECLFSFCGTKDFRSASNHSGGEAEWIYVELTAI